MLLFCNNFIFLLHVKNLQLLKSIWNRIRNLRYISMSFLLMQPATEKSRNCPPEKILDPRKKIRTTKYPREKISYPRHTHKEKIRNHEIPKRKYFEPTKYSREKILDPRNTHEGTRPTRPTMARDPRNLAHSQKLLHHYQHSKNELNS